MTSVLGFIQNEVLGMKWLDRAVGQGLELLGLDTQGLFYRSLRFFIYDTIKIMVLLAVLIFVISYIQSYFPPERTRDILGRFRGMTARILAALLGTVTPFCSCSSIPLFIGFTGAGLPLGVTFSFLISSPMVDLGSLVLLSGVFGFKAALIYVVLGLLVAVLGGWAIEKAHMENEVEEYIRAASFAGKYEGQDIGKKERAEYALSQVRETARKVFPYVLIGVAVGSVIHNAIPERFIVTLLGKSNPFGVIIAVLAGAPLYADIFGTIPIAEALLAKGAMLGVVLSFMMAVTTLSLPSLIMLRKAVKPRLLALFIAICITGITLSGYIFNFLQGYLI